MLLRNLDINSGLCNGTTLQILSINHKVLKVKITNGSHIGNIGLIPRIDVTPSETSLPFRMKRRQFPNWLCYAMIIDVNDTQGPIQDNNGKYTTNVVYNDVLI